MKRTEENEGHRLIERFAEIETRMGLPLGSKTEKLIRSLSLFSGRPVSDVMYGETFRYYVFWIINDLGNGKYGSAVVIETPNGSKLRYKAPLNQTHGKQYFSESEETEVVFNRSLDEDNDQAVQRAMTEIDINHEIYITSPSFRKRRWAKKFMMPDKTIVEIAGDECEILNEQPIAKYKLFKGRKFQNIETELVYPIYPPPYNTLRRATREVKECFRQQGVLVTDDSQSKSNWLKSMLIEGGLMNSRPNKKVRI